MLDKSTLLSEEIAKTHTDNDAVSSESDASDESFTASDNNHDGADTGDGDEQKNSENLLKDTTEQPRSDER